MLNVWLQRDLEASWGKLLNAMQNVDIYRPSPSIKTGNVFVYKYNNIIYLNMYM